MVKQLKKCLCKEHNQIEYLLITKNYYTIPNSNKLFKKLLNAKIKI